MTKTDIFNFNHIQPKKRAEIKALYTFYPKKLNLAVNLTSAALIVTGTVAGGVTLNTIVLGTISGAALMLKTFSEIKDYKKKIEMSKFAYTTYEKVLVHLRSSLRGNQFNHPTFINELKLLDEIIIDLCPLTDEFEKKCNKKFTTK